jgi:hypothetical protein
MHGLKTYYSMEGVLETFELKQALKFEYVHYSDNREPGNSKKFAFRIRKIHAYLY